MDNDPPEPQAPLPGAGPALPPDAPTDSVESWSAHVDDLDPGVERPLAARVAIVLAILLPFFVALLALVWAVQQGDNPSMAEAVDPGTSTVERLEDGTYALWARNADGTAVRWNGCEPIRWVLNTSGAPLGAQEQLQVAMDRITDVTGLAFEFLGETDEIPTRARRPWQPDRYAAEHWAPVLVAWRDPAISDTPLTDLDRAVAIPVAVGSGEVRNFVTAQVIFNKNLAGAPGFDDRRRSIGITMLHELLHVIGLQHVDDTGELMFPFPTAGRPEFGNGDIAGMAELGTAHPCLETPEPVQITVNYS